MNYTRAYHAACNELVAFGASRPECATRCRNLIAQALRDMRRMHGSERARDERGHLLFIAGHFPNKVQS